jgi:hypothetical protein
LLDQLSVVEYSKSSQLREDREYHEYIVLHLEEIHGSLTIDFPEFEPED